MITEKGKKEYYKALIDNELSNREIAKMLGICETSLYNKIEGKNEFKHSEILKMIKIFGRDTAKKIFFDIF